jgi:hypothetical protein
VDREWIRVPVADAFAGWTARLPLDSYGAWIRLRQCMMLLRITKPVTVTTVTGMALRVGVTERHLATLIAASHGEVAIVGGCLEITGINARGGDGKSSNAQRQKRWRERQKGRNALPLLVTGAECVLVSSSSPEETNTHTAAVTGTADVGGREFSTFWEAYPKKVGQKAALTAWREAAGRPALDVILAAVAAQAKLPAWRKDNGRWIPHPARWLRDGRWTDAVPASKPKPAPGPKPPDPRAVAEFRLQSPSDQESWRATARRLLHGRGTDDHVEARAHILWGKWLATR